MSDSPNELETLKERADQIGVSYHPSIGVDKLREKVNAKLQGSASEEVSEEEQKSSPVKSKRDAIAEARKEAGKLVRINVSCMNPAKREWSGEIFTVGNKRVGTFRKFVKFNTDEGYHVPNIIYEMLKERKFNTFYTEKSEKGVAVRKAKLIPEFNIQVLPQLTMEELKELAKTQAARG